MLLYIYGPLDQAPSWRYRDADQGKSQPSTSSKTDDGGDDMRGRLLERLNKGCTDFPERLEGCEEPNEKGGKGQKEEPLSSEPALTFHEVTSGHRPSSDHGDCSDGNRRVHVTDRTEVSSGAIANTTTSGAANDDSRLQAIAGNSSAQGPEENLCVPPMTPNFELASDILDEVLCTFPQSVPEDNGKNSEKSAAPSGNSSSSKTVMAFNGDRRATSTDQNEGAGIKDQSGNELTGPRVSSAAEVKAVGEGEPGSRSHEGEDRGAGPSGWSHGTSVRSGDGAVVQVPNAVDV